MGKRQDWKFWYISVRLKIENLDEIDTMDKIENMDKIEIIDKNE